MILVYTAFFTPVAIYFMRSFFLAHPARARGGGAGRRLHAVRRVRAHRAARTRAPGLVATFVYAFLFAWDELLFVASLTEHNAETLPIGIRNFIGNYSQDYGQLMAAGVVSTIPVVSPSSPRSAGWCAASPRGRSRDDDDRPAPKLGGEPDAPLPPGFRFGAATAAFQIEGATHEDGRGESIWDRFCRTPGRGRQRRHAATSPATTTTAGEADLDLMAALGLESYRFSIAWPRVQPDGRGRGQRRAASHFYRRARRGAARARHRADRDALPLGPAAGAAGRGRLGRRATRRSASPSTRRSWPTSSATSSRSGSPTTSRGSSPSSATRTGRKAPGIRDWPTALRVVAPPAALARPGARRRCARARRRRASGIALNLAPIHPAGPARRTTRPPRGGMDGHLNRWFLDPLLRGALPRRHARRSTSARYGAARRRSRDGDLRGDRARRSTSSASTTTTRSASRADARRRRRCGCARPRRPAADHGDGLGGRPRRAARAARCALRRDYGDAADLHHRERRGLRRPAGAATGRVEDPRAHRVPARPPRGARAARSPTASTCAATACGRCWTTSSGSTATTSASGSSTSTTTTQRARPEAQRALVPRLHRGPAQRQRLEAVDAVTCRTRARRRARARACAARGRSAPPPARRARGSRRGSSARRRRRSAAAPCARR